MKIVDSIVSLVGQKSPLYIVLLRTWCVGRYFHQKVVLGLGPSGRLNFGSLRGSCDLWVVIESD